VFADQHASIGCCCSSRKSRYHRDIPCISVVSWLAWSLLKALFGSIALAWSGAHRKALKRNGAAIEPLLN
jgi:hypothetical protein